MGALRACGRGRLLCKLPNWGVLPRAAPICKDCLWLGWVGACKGVSGKPCDAVLT